MKPTIITLAILSVPQIALADGSKRVVLVESYYEARPADMARNVEQITQAFGSENVLAGDALRKRMQSVFSHPITKAGSDEIQTLLKRASDGAVAYSSSSFNVAISELNQAADGLAKQSIALSLDQKLRDVRRDALLTLIKSLVKTGNLGGAQGAVRELVRSFPEIHAFPEEQYPPRVVALGDLVLKEKRDQAGSVSIETRSGRRRFFLDEQAVPAGQGPRTVTGLLPGTYRLSVLAPTGDVQRAGLRLVEVKPHETTKIVIDSEIEDRLETDAYVGLRLASKAEREHFEIPLACAIARSLGASEVIILTQQRSPNSEAELFGALYETERGHREWGVILPLAPEPDERALARFALSLRTRREVEGVRVAPSLPPTEEVKAEPAQPEVAPPAVAPNAIVATAPAAPRRQSHHALPAWPGWVVAGLSLSGIGVGAWFLTLDGQPSCAYPASAPKGIQCPKVYDTGTQGIAYTALGATFLVAGLTWGIVNAVRNRH